MLGSLIERVGPCRLEARREGTHYEALVRSIVFQQLSGKAAGTIHARFRALYPRNRPRPELVLQSTDAALRAAGLSRQKVGYLRDLATHTRNGLPLERLSRFDDERVIETLTVVKGIGRWTAEMYLMFRLGRHDVLPVDDLGIRSAMRRAYNMRALPDKQRMRKIAEAWRPYRSLACFYLWRSLDSAKKAAPKPRVKVTLRRKAR